MAEKKYKKLKTRTIEYTYYHCSHRKDSENFKCSERMNIQEFELEKKIIDILESIEIIPDFIIWAKGVLQRIHKEETVKIGSTFDLVNKQIEDEKKKLSKLFDYLINETISEKEYKERKIAIETEIQSLERKRIMSNANEKNWLEIMEQTLDFIGNARTKFLL